VPKGFYKVLYNDEKEFRRCFYYENEISPDIENDKLKNHVVDCKDIRF
jgi:endonuclease G